MPSVPSVVNKLAVSRQRLESSQRVHATMTADPLVSLDRVSMAYGRGDAAVHAIEEVTLDIARGEFIAVVGPSGCGKSSLMKLISGLHPALAGALSVEGKPVTGPVKSVGMAFQQSNLLPWRSAHPPPPPAASARRPPRSPAGRPWRDSRSGAVSTGTALPPA